MNVGTDAETGAFAVESIRRWWHKIGKAAYLHATRLLITADAGGSNGSRSRLQKAELAGSWPARQFMEIWAKSRCSIRFHLDVPGCSRREVTDDDLQAGFFREPGAGP